MVITTSQTQSLLFGDIAKVKDKQTSEDHAIRTLNEVSSSFKQLSFKSDITNEPSTSFGLAKPTLDTYSTRHETVKTISPINPKMTSPKHAASSFTDLGERMDELVIDPKNQHRCPGKTKFSSRQEFYYETTSNSYRKSSKTVRSDFDFKGDTVAEDSDRRYDDSLDVSAEELAAYFEEGLHLPKKMSLAAEMMYT